MTRVPQPRPRAIAALTSVVLEPLTQVASPFRQPR